MGTWTPWSVPAMSSYNVVLCPHACHSSDNSPWLPVSPARIVSMIGETGKGGLHCSFWYP